MIAKKRKKRKSRKHVLGAIVTTVIVLGVIVFLFATNWKIEQRREEVSAKGRYLQQEVERLEMQKEELESKMSEVGESEYLEREAREKLQLKKIGEEVVTILAPEKTGESTQQTQEEPKSFWQKLMEMLGLTEVRE